MVGDRAEPSVVVKTEAVSAPPPEIGSCPRFPQVSFTRRKLVFDPAAETFPGDEEANRYLKREYREPYVVPEQV